MYNIYSNYKQSSVQTADRGQLVILIYDHCIKWCGAAKEAIDNGEYSKKALAHHKVQAGLNELVCSLDMDKGGEVATNLKRLYDFYGAHLNEGLLQNKGENYADVQNMMSTLREGWVSALAEARKNRGFAQHLSAGTPQSYVSMVG
jgi:flagellar protein FliS